tara:strand:- start:4262 stop:5629 length:1368 start_codon:yes stop_codon:yes gene_type:complete
MNFTLGQKFVKQKEFGKALKIFLRLEKNNEIDFKIYFYLGMINFELNNYNKSAFYYNKFLEKEPNSMSALHNLAIVKQIIGHIESAKNIYLKLIKMDKYKIRPYYGLFTLNENFLTNKHFEVIREIEKKLKLNLYEKGIIKFILSKKQKKNKNYKNEIKYLKDFHDDIFNFNYEYNKSSQFYYNNIISQNYDKIKIIDNKKYIKNNSLSPIFIIGLPRSGSTLIESILTSGIDEVKSVGESHVINMSILNQVGPKIYNNNFKEKNFTFEIDPIIFQDSVIKKYEDFSLIKNSKNQFFIDKSLENFFNIEIILNLYPKAKFLHTLRNPYDSAISIFQSMLPDLSWTHYIKDILNYMDNYFKALNYFKSRFPGVIMDIDLEKFTHESEKFSKEICQFCNLNWTNDILNFHKRNDLHSKTLSFSQVRKKVSKYDDNKYKPYFHLLEDYSEKYSWINSE